MKFEKVNVDELIPATYNPRKDLKPSDSEYQKIKKSIEEFGYVEPIIVNKDNTIIGGHQRLKVLKDLGYKEIDVVRIDIDKTKEKALNIALNKISGEWDDNKLKELLFDLKDEDIVTGFDINEIDKLFEKIEFEEPEIEFGEILGEEHNYIVLYFDNEVDWLQAETLFDIKRVKNYSTRKDGFISEGMRGYGIGRVMNGGKAIDRIKGEYSES